MDTTTQFWEWFEENNKAYTFLDSVDHEVKEKLIDELLERLHRFSDGIYFEIGGPPDGNRELIITAEGNKKYFQKVEELIDSAPQINGWSFIAFKPPMAGHFKSKWSELELNTEDLWFRPLSNKNNPDLGVRIYLKNYDLIENKKLLMTMLYKILDTIVGEKCFAQDISYVDADVRPDEPEKKGIHPILKLPAFIKWYKSQQAESNSSNTA